MALRLFIYIIEEIILLSIQPIKIKTNKVNIIPICRVIRCINIFILFYLFYIGNSVFLISTHSAQ